MFIAIAGELMIKINGGEGLLTDSNSSVKPEMGDKS